MTKKTETDSPAPAPKKPSVDELEQHRLRGKAAARDMLLAKTRQVRLTRDCPTSKGRLCHGMVVRLPHREADTLVGARAAKEIDA
jgi:hypothetical protein